MRYYKLLLILTLVATIYGSGAQPRLPVGFAYWDVDRLYDTVPSHFYDDIAFTPKGLYRWNTQRYRDKIEHTAAVIDSMQMPLVALFGVENEGVVRDIVQTSKGDYSYLHRTLNSRNGLDFALLYHGDLFFIDFVYTNYDRIYIEGEMHSKRVGIWLTRYGRRQLSAAAPHQDGVDAVIVAGGLAREDLKRMGLTDYFISHTRLGHGNATSKSGWYLRHRIGVDSRVEVYQSGIYITRWLLSTDNGAPHPTISYRGYEGGYSSYLPIYLYFFLDL